MNIHFVRNADFKQELPRRAYAYLDEVDAPDGSAFSSFLRFEAVDADWFDRYGEAVGGYLSSTRAIDGQWRHPPSEKRHPSLLEKAPLFRIEIEGRRAGQIASVFTLPPSGEDGAGRLAEGLQNTWFEFSEIEALRETSNEVDVAFLYRSLFEMEPERISTSARKLPPQLSALLATTFSLDDLPVSTDSELRALTSRAHAEYLAIYDVGQGNANALLDRAFMPTLYFDLGAGVYRNAKTTPADLRFCFTHTPGVVLSHWDADHWAGVYAHPSNNRALHLDWLVPRQRIGPLHAAFAHHIISTGGRVHTFDPATGRVASRRLACRREVRLSLGMGRDRNNSGIVLSVLDTQAPQPRSWLLTGDCDYSSIRSSVLLTPVVAMVVPHHGGSLGGTTTVPAPLTSQPYRRLAYSFGSGNRHGPTGVQHPTHMCTAKHESSGWDHGRWIPSRAPGWTKAHGDLVATCTHPPAAKRGGALIGWAHPPRLPLSLACYGVHCTTQFSEA